MAGGRPTVVTESVLLKLEEAFAMGCPDTEACIYANISPSTLYKYQEEHPEFTEHKLQLKETPVLKARKTVIDSLEKDVNSAWRLLERKDKDLNPKQNIDITSLGEQIPFSHEQALSVAKRTIKGAGTDGDTASA